MLITGPHATPLGAQEAAAAVQAEQADWQAPDIAALPTDWWTRLAASSEQATAQRISRFLSAIEQSIRGLTADDRLAAQESTANLRNLFDLLALARQGPSERPPDPPLTKETYSLDELIELRRQWRELSSAAAQVRLNIEQTDSQISLLQERRDKLQRQYEEADAQSPARLLLGIKWVAARVDQELAAVRIANFRLGLADIEKHKLAVSEQQSYAAAHLVAAQGSLAGLEAAVSGARDELGAVTEKAAALQLQLLSVLSAEAVNPSLELLRKQQLTRTSAEVQLAQLRELLAAAKLNWHRFRAGKLGLGRDVQGAGAQARRATEDALKQVAVWSSASQATLIAPVPDDSLNTVKNFEIAQSVARETLAVIEAVRGTGDELLLVQEILTTEMVSSQSGLRNTWARIGLAIGKAWDRLSELGDLRLFELGDTPVTPFGILKMLFILGLAFGLSRVIRYLLGRGLRVRKASDSPAFYTLGRLLHYVIVVAGLFAALGSIGIDFTSFALIAGALSVGIGFGLQAIVNNFVSGLILLFEGTLRVGDYIELDSGLCGIVREINTRATVVNTNDNVDVVVPNSELVTTKLTNWTLRESLARVRIPFGVAYGTDKELVRKVALEAVKEVEFALTNMRGREPQIRLTGFGDNALEFDALIWVSRQGVRRPQRIRAAFLWALETAFSENGIEIPFPQRDIHIKSDFRTPAGNGDPSGAEPPVSGT